MTRENYLISSSKKKSAKQVLNCMYALLKAMHKKQKLTKWKNNIKNSFEYATYMLDD